MEFLNNDLLELYKNKVVLITGGRGYLGSALAEAFSKMDCKLVLFDGDVSIKSTWQNVLYGVDYLFHLAAVEYDYTRDPVEDLYTNALSILHLLNVCIENDLMPRIIFSSSTNIFGDAKVSVVNENIRDDPSAFWSAHKLLAENYLRVYYKKYNIKSVILRLPNVYGPVSKRDTIDRMVINRVVKRAINTGKLALYNNRRCFRDYIFIDDVIRAFLMTGNIDDDLCDGRFYVIGSQEGRSIEKVWNIIAKNIPREIEIIFNDALDLEPIERRSFISNATKFCQAAGWNPQINLEKGIQLTVKAFNNEP